jgi:hypothetical protein
MLAKFIRANCVVGPGLRVRYGELADAFLNSLPLKERAEWSKRRVGAELDALGFARGIGPGGQLYVIGIAMPTHDYVIINGCIQTTAI